MFPPKECAAARAPEGSKVYNDLLDSWLFLTATEKYHNVRIYDVITTSLDFVRHSAYLKMPWCPVFSIVVVEMIVSLTR
jgi:hypothetical protein